MLLNKHNLNIANLASKENSRYTLQGIQVTKDGTAVTDGHIAVKVSAPLVSEHVKPEMFPVIDNVENLPQPDFILPADVALRVSKALPRKTTIPIIQHALVGQTPQEKIVLAVTDLDTPVVFQPRPLTGQFPNLDAVYPKPEQQKFVTLKGNEFTAVSLDADNIVRVMRELIAFMEDARMPAVTIRVRTNWDAVQFTAKNESGQKFDALIMPVRGTEIDELCNAAKKPAPMEETAQPVPDQELKDHEIPA